MKIDSAQLVPMPSEFKKGGLFYVLQNNGEFETAMITEEELQQPERRKALLARHMELKAQNRLFVSRNAPWKSVSGSGYPFDLAARVQIFGDHIRLKKL